MSRARILLYVQHLLGTGHLQRAAILARALAAAGMEVDLVSGGMPTAGLDTGAARLIQLPPARARGGGDWSLVDAAGAPVDETWRAHRRDRLLEIFRDTRPDAVMIEMFPFGRRQMRFELMPLLQAARERAPAPLMLCSVRDVLQTGGKPERVQETVTIADDYFDFVMVHGDRDVIPFADSFPAAGRIGERLVYTGYVAAPNRPATDGAAPNGAAPNGPAPDGTGAGEAVVSAGGGAVGAALLEAALAARPLTGLSQAVWRLLAGPNLTEADFQAIGRRAGPGVVVERSRSDFRQLLGRCAVSISQAGYNTLIDVVAAGAPAVVVPYAQEGETEQTMRARRFSEMGLVHALPESALSPDTLSQAVDAAVAGGRRRHVEVNLAGAETSANLVAGWLAERGAE